MQLTAIQIRLIKASEIQFSHTHKSFNKIFHFVLFFLSFSTFHFLKIKFHIFHAGINFNSLNIQSESEQNYQIAKLCFALSHLLGRAFVNKWTYLSKCFLCTRKDKFLSFTSTSVDNAEWLEWWMKTFSQLSCMQNAKYGSKISTLCPLYSAAIWEWIGKDNCQKLISTYATLTRRESSKVYFHIIFPRKSFVWRPSSRNIEKKHSLLWGDFLSKFSNVDYLITLYYTATIGTIWGERWKLNIQKSLDYQ